ncbi:unnamed protein product [Peronospora belbahrii]|uniref:Uncharacterized protein n=1 Tax=Peronospora belbahrii TaxID=622444 RepID=A0ABN8CKZ8_9STRA|nr:unnamed protein product [Peronospora belbahrii]
MLQSTRARFSSFNDFYISDLIRRICRNNACFKLTFFHVVKSRSGGVLTCNCTILLVVDRCQSFFKECGSTRPSAGANEDIIGSRFMIEHLQAYTG